MKVIRTLAAAVAAALAVVSAGAVPASADTANAAATPAPVAAAAAAPDTRLYVGVTPTRLVDTRPGGATADGLVAGVGAIGPGGTLHVPVEGRSPAPGDGIGAVALNVTAVGPSASTYLTVYPSGRPVPLASNLNVAAGQVVPNMVIAKVGTDGAIDIYNAAGQTHVVVDLLGWFPEAGGFEPLDPGRLADTRSNGSTVDGQVRATGPIPADKVLTVPVGLRAGMPAVGVAAVALNVTAVGPTDPTYLTAYPRGQLELPLASNLNASPGQTVPNMVISKVGHEGKVSVYNAAGDVHTIVDVLGWFPVGSGFEPLSPARLADTRPDAVTADGQVAGVGAVVGGTSLRVPIRGRGPVPASGVGAVALNVTAIGGDEATYLTVHPGGTARPLASNLNVAPGQVVPNMVIAKVGTDGAVDVFSAAGSTHVIVDVLGWFPDDGPAAPGTVAGVSAGGFHSCARLDDGTARCWGLNEDGQLGNGSTTSSLVPTQVAGLSGVQTIAAAGYHTCALLQTGAVRCWGYNENGQLGNGTKTSSSFPVAVTGVTNAIALSTGSALHSCAVLTDHSVRCWGYNASGQLGNGTTTSSSAPVAVVGLTDAVAVATGWLHTCALRSTGEVLCWGKNTSGQIGDGTTFDRLMPVSTGVTGAVSIAAAEDHTCAVLGNGTARCWGKNTHGELGDGTDTPSSSPRTVTGLTDAVAIGVGGHSSCALLGAGGVRCWGWNEAGQLANGTIANASTPVAVLDVTGATQLTSGFGHMCVRLPDASARCWGFNDNGQVGNHTRSFSERWPTRVIGI